MIAFYTRTFYLLQNPNVKIFHPPLNRVKCPSNFLDSTKTKTTGPKITTYHGAPGHHPVPFPDHYILAGCRVEHLWSPWVHLPDELPRPRDPVDLVARDDHAQVVGVRPEGEGVELHILDHGAADVQISCAKMEGVLFSSEFRVT